MYDDSELIEILSKFDKDDEVSIYSIAYADESSEASLAINGGEYIIMNYDSDLDYDT